MVQDVVLDDADGGDGGGGGVVGVLAAPEVGVVLGDGGHLRVEFDADDFAEGELAGEKNGAAFAGSDVEESVIGDVVRRIGGKPVLDEGTKDGWGDSVVGSDVLVVGVAGDEVAGGD